MACAFAPLWDDLIENPKCLRFRNSDAAKHHPRQVAIVSEPVQERAVQDDQAATRFRTLRISTKFALGNTSKASL